MAAKSTMPAIKTDNTISTIFFRLRYLGSKTTVFSQRPTNRAPKPPREIVRMTDKAQSNVRKPNTILAQRVGDCRTKAKAKEPSIAIYVARLLGWPSVACTRLIPYR